MATRADLAVLYEHPEWQLPLFAELDRRGIAYEAIDLKQAAFADPDPLIAPLWFNQASPSAYVRGNARAVPMAVAMIGHLEARGARVLNGSRAFALELSKSSQVRLVRDLGLRAPRTIAFNHVDALRRTGADVGWPAVLKPEQGGSGARMHLVESLDELDKLLADQPELWEPDNLLLLQEHVDHDEAFGIVRIELVGGELLYAVRVVAHGTFNLCPSEVCNPVDGTDGTCAVPGHDAGTVEFHPYPDVPQDVVVAAQRIFEAGGLDVGGIEYMVDPAGEPVFYDVNANSNLRPSVAAAFGVDPFARVVDFLVAHLP